MPFQQCITLYKLLWSAGLCAVPVMCSGYVGFEDGFEEGFEVFGSSA
jgi:hypothetical protein